jgi:hypothetical protein
VPRTRFHLYAPFALILLAGCGGGGGLFATVPPPVEFAASLRPGVEELPAAGTYPGSVNVDRVVYAYNVQTGRWTLQSSTSLGSSSTAEASIGSGTITISDGEALFSGTLELVHGGSPATRATLTATDGSSADYPYSLYHDATTTLAVSPHLKVKRLAKYLVQFDRYSFVFNLE